MEKDPQKILRKIRANPTQAIERARNGVLIDLAEVANLWQEVPGMLSLGVLDAFICHLDENKVPTDPSPANNGTSAAQKAFMALLGISKCGNLIGNGVNYASILIKAWPGVFKWSAFFFAARVQPSSISPGVRRATMDVITSTWYSISHVDELSNMMVATKGSIEIATKLWILEDESLSNAMSVVDIPTGSAALDALLSTATTADLDRLVSAAGGKPDVVVQMALSRLRGATKQDQIQAIPATIFADLVNHLSRIPDHPLRYAFLHTGKAIQVMTKIALNVSVSINDPGRTDLLNLMVTSFGYLANCLESTEGFTWVSQSIKAGLLEAFVDCSPQFSRLAPDDCEMILHIVRDILPQYLVYRSVIQNIDGSMTKINNKSRSTDRVRNSIAWDVWHRFHKIVLERSVVAVHAKALKGKGATCDNVKCHKVDDKNTFQKCAACSSTLYCSKQCQVEAWAAGHKTMCKLKQRERLEGKSQSISKQDIAFFHHLATRDARHHIPLLRRLATRDFPDVPPAKLIICIDYTSEPAKYSLIPLENQDQHLMETSGSVNAEARNEALIEQAKNHPGKYTLIQSKIANGQSLQLVTTVVTGNFWSKVDGGDFSESDDEGNIDDKMSGTSVDEVDTMMARMVLNQFLVKNGEPAAF